MLEIGTSKGLFEKNWALESCLTTKCWLVSAWEGVSKFGIDVSLPLSAELPLQQEHDQLLMHIWTLSSNKAAADLGVKLSIESAYISTSLR